MRAAPRVTINYVDGSAAFFDAGVWGSQRAEGVDQVVIRNPSGQALFNGHSVYWLYREGSVWVAGQASFHYNRVIPPEVLFLPDGTQTTRSLEYVPDLPHSAVKMGWWRPDEERPPWP